ncbi:MAG TPA: cupin domain-containing protein [Chloroflexi bacterium]|jgi:mannose-6-phosphate isomerase-like protein (cupin superfamily)|nr:cupin domain-containing protein [Chloroflexota bacterium]
MNIARFDKKKAQPAHNDTILAMDVLPPGVRAPFDHAWGYLQPGHDMEGHAHPTEEIYFFHKGRGVVVVGDEEHPVEAGDVVEIPPDTYHTVRNPSNDELYWFALWWEPVE